MRVTGTKFHERSIAAAHAEVERIRNIQAYEAARRYSPDRPLVYGFVQDDKFDACNADRTEMSRKIRDYERNVWLVGAIRREFVKWTVGPNGLQVIPETSDAKWNEEMLADYLLWCQSPCFDASINMTQVHKQISGEFSTEGGLFWHETFRKTVNGPSEPAIELVRGHQVGSPGLDLYSTSGKTDVNDGVQLGIDPDSGRLSKPIGFWVRDDSSPNGWIFRSTEVMHQVFDPIVPGRFRELTPYHAVIDTLGDLKQLEAFEMQRAKQNAEDAKIFKTATGQLPASEAIRQRFHTVPGAPTPNQDAELARRVEMYKKIIGVKSIAIGANEDVIFPQNANPSAAQQWFWRYKLGQVCAANGVPLILIFPELIESMQGTVVRGVYDNAHEFFRSMTSLFAVSAQRMYLFYADWARTHRRNLFRYPADWNKCRVIPPRAVNVDVGYTAEAQLAKLEAGLTDYDAEAAAHGTTAADIARRKARQIIMFRRIADEESKASNGYFVKPEEIAGQLADIREKLAAAVAASNAKAKQQPQP